MLVRVPNHNEMDDIYLMGFDAWGENFSKSKYLNICRNSQKYKLGNWFCLDIEGKLVSSLIIYKNCLGLKEGYAGLGSIATQPKYRNIGYASALITNCISNLIQENAAGIFLFTEIGNEIYQRFGFHDVKGRENDGLMFLNINHASPPANPSYF